MTEISNLCEWSTLIDTGVNIYGVVDHGINQERFGRGLIPTDKRIEGVSGIDTWEKQAATKLLGHDEFEIILLRTIYETEGGSRKVGSIGPWSLRHEDHPEQLVDIIGVRGKLPYPVEESATKLQKWGIDDVRVKVR